MTNPRLHGVSFFYGKTILLICALLPDFEKVPCHLVYDFKRLFYFAVLGYHNVPPCGLA